MLARRVIALSPDKGMGKQLAVALKAAGGAVDSHASCNLNTTTICRAVLVR